MIKVCEKVGKKEEKKKANRKYVLLFELRKRRKCNYSKGETWGKKKKVGVFREKACTFENNCISSLFLRISGASFLFDLSR